jgi:hypothetical protein
MTSTPNYDSVYRQVQRRLLQVISESFDKTGKYVTRLSLFLLSHVHISHLEVHEATETISFRGVLGRTDFYTQPVDVEKLRTDSIYFLEQSDAITKGLMSLPLVGVDNQLGARGASE